MSKGWFEIPGVQRGDRTVNEQLKGLQHVLVEAKGKAVLDLGCAEGLITQAMVRAGAGWVLGVDNNAGFLRRARTLGLDGSMVEFAEEDLNEPSQSLLSKDFEIVLALAVIHKLSFPAQALRIYARLAAELFVIRLPIGSTGAFSAKHRHEQTCDLKVEMPRLGFVLERDVEGPRSERVHYWRRQAFSAAA